MKLTLLLYGLYWLFFFSSWRSPDFFKKLKERDVIIVMKSEDETVSRSYFFKEGKILSKTGIVQEAASSFIWQNPKIGSEVMIDITKGNPKAIENALVKKKLTLGGDAATIGWFLQVLKQLGKFYFKKNK